MGPDGDVMVEESPPTTSQGRWCPRACAAGAKSRVLAPGTFLFVAQHLFCWLSVCAAAFPMFLLVSTRPLLSFVYCETVHVKPLPRYLRLTLG